MDKTVLFSIPAPEFQALIVDSVNACLKHNKGSNEKESTSNDKLLTREEVCEMLGITKNTLYRYTKEGRLQSYGIGNRVYYKKAEVLDAVKPLKK